jgi:hypothetical protein
MTTSCTIATSATSAGTIPTPARVKCWACSASGQAAGTPSYAASPVSLVYTSTASPATCSNAPSFAPASLLNLGHFYVDVARSTTTSTGTCTLIWISAYLASGTLATSSSTITSVLTLTSTPRRPRIASRRPPPSLDVNVHVCVTWTGGRQSCPPRNRT